MKSEVRAAYQRRTSKAKTVSGYIGCVALLVGAGLPVLEHFTGAHTDSKIVLGILAVGLILVGAPVTDLIKAWRES